MERYDDLNIVYHIYRERATDWKTNCAKAIAIFLIIRYTEKIESLIALSWYTL